MDALARPSPRYKPHGERTTEDADSIPLMECDRTLLSTEAAPCLRPRPTDPAARAARCPASAHEIEPIRLRLSRPIPARRLCGAAAGAGLGVELCARHAAGILLAAHPLACARDAVRVHRQRHRGLSADGGSQLDGRAGLCRPAADAARRHLAGGAPPDRKLCRVARGAGGRGGPQLPAAPRRTGGAAVAAHAQSQPLPAAGAGAAVAL